MVSFGRVLFGGLLLVSGCTASEETTAEKTNDQDGRLRRLEMSFRPSDYDRPAKTSRKDILAPESAVSDSSTATNPASTSEQVPGFRVQIVSTTSIDDANAQKALAESLFPGEWFYLQYDQPTYKIRAGNFLIRFDAERFRDQVSEKGFPGAWVVPERVFRQPPPR